MMLHAYETDNGPGGLSWELHDDAGRWVRSLSRHADLASLAPVTVYTLADWERAMGEDSPPALELA